MRTAVGTELALFGRGGEYHPYLSGLAGAEVMLWDVVDALRVPSVVHERNRRARGPTVVPIVVPTVVPTALPAAGTLAPGLAVASAF